MPDAPIGYLATIQVDRETRLPRHVPQGEEYGPDEDLQICSARSMQLAVFGLQNPEIANEVLGLLSKEPEFEQITDDASGMLVEVLPPAGVEL